MVHTLLSKLVKDCESCLQFGVTLLLQYIHNYMDICCPYVCLTLNDLVNIPITIFISKKLWPRIYYLFLTHVHENKFEALTFNSFE